jgi:hypothetical protein
MKAIVGLAAVALAAACASPPDLEGVYLPEGVERGGSAAVGSNDSVRFWKGGSCSIKDKVDEGAVIVERTIPCTYRLHGNFVLVEVKIQGLGSERNGVHQGFLSADRQSVDLFERKWTRSAEKSNQAPH